MTPWKMPLLENGVRQGIWVERYHFHSSTRASHNPRIAGPISSAGSAGFLCNFSSTFASSRLGFWYGTISKICVLWGRAAKGRWSRRGLFFKDFRPLLTSVSAGEHASNQQVRGVPQTSSRMVAISSSRNFGRRIRLSGGQVSRHVKTRKVPCVVDMMPLLQVNQSLRI